MKELEPTMIHGRRSCPGNLVGKSLVKWEEMVRMREKKIRERKKETASGGGKE